MTEPAKHLPENEALSKIQWQFFGTLTFKDARLRDKLEGKPDRVRKMMFCAFGREIGWNLCRGKARWFEEYCVNVVRLEPGEVSGLWHYHFLMDSLPKPSVNRSTCAAMEAWWRKLGGGHCQVHVFDSSLNGEEYVTKCLNLGDHYESRKFAGAVHLMLSPAFFKVMKALGRSTKRRSAMAARQDRERGPAETTFPGAMPARAGAGITEA